MNGDIFLWGLLSVVHGGAFVSVGHAVGEFCIWLIIITDRGHYKANIQIKGQLLTSH